MPRIKKSEEQDSADRNLAAIKRIDPFADWLVDTSPHVSLYDFVQEGSKWDKTGVEGPLFIYHRIDKPLHSIMIANRQNPNDFVEPLHTDVKLRHQSPYVYMYKKSGAIKALSFMGEDECKRIFEVLSQLCQQQKDPEKCEVPFQASLNTLVSEASANSKMVDKMATVSIAAKPVDELDQKVEPQKGQPSFSSANDVKVKKPKARKPKQRDDLNRNLIAIKRIDSFAESVVGTSHHVSLFEFDAAGNKWVKSIFDGPFFIYKRLDIPVYSFMIANRQSPKNFVEPITKELKLRFEPPFIHFFRPTGTIKGLSFSEVPECQKVFDLLCSLRGPLVDPALENSLVTGSVFQEDVKPEQISQPDVVAEKPSDVPKAVQMPTVEKTESEPSSVRDAEILDVPVESVSTAKESVSKYEKAAALKLKRAENGRNNLEVVKKIDLFADMILGGCSHVSLYNFDSKARKWLKTDMNGPMFIYKRIDYPFHSFVIVNRQSSTSHVEPLLKGVTVKYEPPYLFIYRPDGIVKGLWFFNKNECRKVYECLHPLCDH